MSVTCGGSIIVARRSPKSRFRIGKRKYANPKATIALENVVSSAPRALIQMLFHIQWPTGATLKRNCGNGLSFFSPVKFHVQLCGRKLLSKVEPRGLNAAATSHSNG